MERAIWKHVCGNTWCMECHVTIPVYFLNEREVILLDSGYADRDRNSIDELLQEKDVRVRAILGSHSHNDHNGNHAYYQNKHGAEIILRDVESAIVSDFSPMTTAYWPGTAEDMRRELPHLLLKADRVYIKDEREICIDGRTFCLVPLPGHTPGHTGIVTPDGVFYVGDALMAPEVMQQAKLPTAMNWQQDIESKQGLKKMRHDKYILAHRGVYDEITSVAEKNIEDKLQRAEQIVQWLSENSCWTLNQVEQLLWEKLNLCSKTFMAQTIFRRNVCCALEYLVISGKVSRGFRAGTVYYAVR